MSKPNEDEIMTVTPSAEPEIVPQTMPELIIPEPEQPQPPVEEKKPVQPAKTSRKVTAQDAELSAAEVAAEIAEAEKSEKPAYCFPPINLLKNPSRSMADGTLEMRENTRRLNEALASFKIEAHIINVTRGPSVTR